MIVQHRGQIRRVSRLTLVGDPGFFSFIGGLGRSLLGLPPAATGLIPAALPPASQGALALPSGQGIMAAGGAGFEVGTAIGKRIGARIFPSGGSAATAIARGRGFARAGGRMRRRRRINPGNFRALGRALRRIHSFEKRARRVIRITHPHARGKITFRRRGRKRAAA